MPKPRSEVIDVILQLAGEVTGAHSSHEELAKYSPAHVNAVAAWMVRQGELIKVKVSHKHVRYFTDPKVAAVYEKKIAQRKAAKQRKKTAAVNFGAPVGGAVITEHTKITICPSHPPRFQEVVIPGLYGGLQRGRVGR